MNTNKELITLDELCETLSIGRNAAYRLLNQNEIKAFRIGKKWKIPKKSVIDYITNKSH